MQPSQLFEVLQIEWSNTAPPLRGAVTPDQLSLLNSLIGQGGLDRSGRIRFMRALACDDYLQSSKELSKWQASRLIEALMEPQGWTLSKEGKELINYVRSRLQLPERTPRKAKRTEGLPLIET